MAFLDVLLGLIAGGALILVGRRWGGDSRRFYGAALFVAALVLLLFALIGGQGRDVWLEAAGLALFGAAAWWGQRTPLLIAAGWLAHIAWDVLLHPLDSAGYVPPWYVWACVGFDLLVGVYLLLKFRRRE